MMRRLYTTTNYSNIDKNKDFSEIANDHLVIWYQTVKEAVKRIFENIDFKFYDEQVEDNLEMILVYDLQ